MYTVVLSRRYKTALKRFSRNKNFSHKALEEVIRMLAQGEKLESKQRDHQLTGEMKEYRECHVNNNILLVYQKHKDVLLILLIDIGTHSSLFKK